MGMKVILTENIERLGKAGDIVTVKEGFARNYLFPKNKAKEATTGNMKMVEALKKREAEENQKKVQEVKALADKISGLSITINAKAGDEDKLYGSITHDMIAEALEAEGVKIDKKEIILEEPIKKLGVYQVAVRLHPDVKASLKVWVVRE